MNAAYRLTDTAEFAFAQLLFSHIDELELDAPLFKIALGFLCIVALFRAENLDVHGVLLHSLYIYSVSLNVSINQ